ncbi:uncharacterized protein LOC116292022 [Actinia tenebrosa]|uniref:Uncharacterized protein LOC116292022 n=1 Tax=Actinia tenebrosa TaxID=6105 RepID=A0A6P8HR11_ACTTE|nr:uncharacterized protein LOC116292022 [Actinia tenebrosa]
MKKNNVIYLMLKIILFLLFFLDINGSNKTCDSIQKENTYTTESKTCVPAIAACVTVIVLLVILYVIQVVITRKKPNAEEIEMNERKERSKGTDKQIYENVVEMSGGATTSGRQLDDVVHEQQQDYRESLNRDKESPTTLQTSKDDGLVRNQEEMDTHIYTALANRDDPPVYQELSFKTGIKKKK